MKKPLLLLCLYPLAAALAFAQYPGELIITEFMAHSEEVPDDQGEYIELYNTTFYPVNLNGCVLQDASNLFVAPTQDIWIEPGQFAVVGRSAVPDVVYYFPSAPPPFNLNNISGDQITLTCNGVLIAGLTYTANQTAGVAMELAATHLHDNGITQEANYGPSSYPFRYLGVSTVDYGSPGYGGNTFVLPITLSYFEVSMEGRNAVLRWASETEQNNSHFLVEHSTDARDFKTLVEIPGAGTTTEARQYTFTHTAPSPGINYYRLQQVDYDGTSTPSDVRTVSAPPLAEPFRLYPTEANEFITLELAEAPNETVQLAAFNLEGQQVAKWRLPAGQRLARLDISQFAGGSYFLKIMGAIPFECGRFTK